MLYAQVGNYGLADYSTYVMIGAPKQGQTLDEVKDLFLAEVEKLKRGEFDETLLQAAINNYKLYVMQLLDSNVPISLLMRSSTETTGKTWSQRLTT